MELSDVVPEGFGHVLDWLDDLAMPIYGLPAGWSGWRVLGDPSRESGQEPGEPPVVTYSVQLRHVDVVRDPPLASLYVETSTAQLPMGAQYLPREVRSGEPFDWEVDVDGVAYEFSAVRTANGLALAKGHRRGCHGDSVRRELAHRRAAAPRDGRGSLAVHRGEGTTHPARRRQGVARS